MDTKKACAPPLYIKSVNSCHVPVALNVDVRLSTKQQLSVYLNPL